MASMSVVMPRLGESVAEATLSRWLVKEGDTVAQDQTIAEASTDKADTELPAPASGRIARLLVREGEAVAVGAAIAEIDTAPGQPRGTESPSSGADRQLPARPAAPAAAAVTARPAGPAQPARPGAGPPARSRTSPLVRRMAREARVDLGAIAGTGAGGRVTKKDLEGWLAARGGPSPRAPNSAAGSSAPPAPSVRAPPVEAPRPAVQAYKPPEHRPMPGDERVPFTRRRRLIAEHMVYSTHTSPHAFCMAEIDMHRVEQARRSAPEPKPSLMSFVARALVRAVRDYPVVNATVLPDAYVLRRAVNLGIAVDTPEGLVVPVLHNADELSLAGLTRAIAEAARRAREGKLTPDDVSGGTITLSNPGQKGNVWGAAIIPQPQVAILRMGSVTKRPVVVSVDGEDALVIRPVLSLVLSYDHRIVDGAVANGYLHRIKELLEEPGGLR